MSLPARSEQEFSSSPPTEIHEPEVEEDGIHPTNPDVASVKSYNSEPQTEAMFNLNFESNVRTRLLSQKNWDATSGCGSVNCQHGTMSPRPLTHRSYGSMASNVSQDGFGGAYPGNGGSSYGEAADPVHAVLGDSVTDGLLGGGPGNKTSTTRFLARRHGIRNERMMLVDPQSICWSLPLLTSPSQVPLLLRAYSELGSTIPVVLSQR